METTVLSPSAWSMKQDVMDTFAQAETMAKEGKAPCTPPKKILQYLVR
jgi:hypothetical protein